MSEHYRSYNDSVPKYLQGRPKSVILHCLSRIRKSDKFSKESVKQLNNSGKFTVTSPSGNKHTIQFSNQENLPECSCKDWSKWHIPCKHFFTIFKHFSNWRWSNLPKKYLESEYLTADSAVLNITNSHQTSQDDLQTMVSHHSSLSPDEEMPDTAVDSDLPHSHVSAVIIHT